jgi:hypothetical protein
MLRDMYQFDPDFSSQGRQLLDLGAEQLIAAEKDGEKIAVEIKCFVAVSAIYEFHLRYWAIP